MHHHVYMLAVTDPQNHEGKIPKRYVELGLNKSHSLLERKYIEVNLLLWQIFGSDIQPILPRLLE
jgi:hypothetical protein